MALGATAAKSLLGRDFRLTRHRGEVFAQLTGPPVTATIHPSAVLRGPGSAATSSSPGWSTTSAWPPAPPERRGGSRLSQLARG